MRKFISKKVPPLTSLYAHFVMELLQHNTSHKTLHLLQNRLLTLRTTTPMTQLVDAFQEDHLRLELLWSQLLRPSETVQQVLLPLLTFSRIPPLKRPNHQD